MKLKAEAYNVTLKSVTAEETVNDDPSANNDAQDSATSGDNYGKNDQQMMGFDMEGKQLLLYFYI